MKSIIDRLKTKATPQSSARSQRGSLSKHWKSGRLHSVAAANAAMDSVVAGAM